MKQVAENAQQGCIHCSLLVKLAKAVSRCFRKEVRSFYWHSFKATKFEFSILTDSEHVSESFEMDLVFKGSLYPN